MAFSLIETNPLRLMTGVKLVYVTFITFEPTLVPSASVAKIRYQYVLFLVIDVSVYEVAVGVAILAKVPVAAALRWTANAVCVASPAVQLRTAVPEEMDALFNVGVEGGILILSRIIVCERGPPLTGPQNNFILVELSLWLFMKVDIPRPLLAMVESNLHANTAAPPTKVHS